MSKYQIKIDKYGTKRYYLNGNLHREDGPAAEWAKPAIEYANAYKEWWLNGKHYGINNKFTNESWIKFIKTLIFY